MLTLYITYKIIKTIFRFNMHIINSFQKFYEQTSRLSANYHPYSSSTRGCKKPRILDFCWMNAISATIYWKSWMAMQMQLVCPKNSFSGLSSCTATASFMGTNAFVKINKEWWEPSIIWFVIAARKGEKKTAALKWILEPIEAIQNRLKTLSM